MNTDKSDMVHSITHGSTICLVTGKGGVGKTTFARLLAHIASAKSPNILLVNLSDFTNLVPPAEDGVESEASNADLESAPYGDHYKILNLEPKSVLVEYLIEHGLGSVASKLLSTGIINVIATAIPGIRDLLLLGKLKQLEATGDYDLIVVDLPASGHALTFLTSPAGLLEIARVGPLRTQAEEVLEMLKDPARASCVVVTVPEETPVAESLELLASISGKTSVAIGCLTVNQILPQLVGSDDALSKADSDAVKAWEFRQRKSGSQMRQLESLMDSFGGTLVAIETVAVGSDGRPQIKDLERTLSVLRIGPNQSETN